jgi:hypothetical protein
MIIDMEENLLLTLSYTRNIQQQKNKTFLLVISSSMPSLSFSHSEKSNNAGSNTRSTTSNLLLPRILTPLVSISK